MLRTCKTCGADVLGLYCRLCNQKAQHAAGTCGGVMYCSLCQDGRMAKGGPASGGERPYTGARKRATAHRTPGPRTEGLDVLRLTLLGAPRTKKTHNRLVVHGGRRKVLPSAQWTAWRDALAASGQVKPCMRLRDQPYNCAALFYRDRASGDLGNYLNGLCDVLEYLGVITNDKWLVSFDGTRLLVDRDYPRVEITFQCL